MKSQKAIELFFVAVKLVIILALSSCSDHVPEQEGGFLPNPDSIGKWLLSDKIESFYSKLDHAEIKTATGLSNNDYLKVIEGQVRVMQQCQDSLGRIIDPVEKIEKYYTTPCYAHSVAVLASSGYTKDSVLIESGMKALDVTCENLKRQFAPGNHGDFFTWPVVFAFKHFETTADSARYNAWRKAIEGIDPSRFYAFYRKYNLNWNLVHSAGEFMRFREGFTDLSYVDTCLLNQKAHFADYGLYNESGNPLAYDLFSRHYLSGMLALGYTGEHLNEYKEILWKGAWMSLFMQSPGGELPTGYRSSHHIWNEAEQAVVFEIYARKYADAGDLKISGVFKRAAMLSLQNMMDWIRPDGSGYIVKNKFPIEKRHGYESYSMHSCYNMLATSMLAQAYEFSADVEENICPADVGAYVVPAIDPFHKIFASVKGNYVQYDTRGDQRYNPTGILRVHLKGAIPQLGPSDGIAALWNEEGTSIALGPCWQNKDGSWTTLAQQSVDPDEVNVLWETPDSVAFILKYNLDSNVQVVETIHLKEDGVYVTNRFKGIDGLKRVTWPLLINDGENHSEISIENRSISNTMNGRGICLKIEDDFSGSIDTSDEEYNHRNGIARVATIEFKGNQFSYSLSALQRN